MEIREREIIYFVKLIEFIKIVNTEVVHTMIVEYFATNIINTHGRDD